MNNLEWGVRKPIIPGGELELSEKPIKGLEGGRETL